MEFPTEIGSENVDSSLWPNHSKSLAGILTEITQNVQSMLRLIQDDQPMSTQKILCLYQSLASMGHLSSFTPAITPSQELDLESGASCSSLKHQLVSPGRTTSSHMLQSLKLNGDLDTNQSAFLFADIFCGELETARRELEAKNIAIETEKRHVLDLESKLSDSGYKIENLESELDLIKECLSVSEAEVSKLVEMLSECKAEKAKLQTDNADDLLGNLRAELRSREIQIEQMEEYLNQVCVKDTEIMSGSGTDMNIVEELKTRVEELEKQVELQRNVTSERVEEKRV